MRRVLALVGLTAALLLSWSKPSAADVSCDLGYESMGTEHVLGIRFAEGKQFIARDVSGAVVACGVVLNGDFRVPVFGAQPGGLLVTIDGTTCFVDHRDYWWM